MMLNVVWKPECKDKRGCTESTVKASTVVQVRAAGAWTKVVAIKMETVIQEIFLRES